MVRVNNQEIHGFTFPGGERHVNVKSIKPAVTFNVEARIKNSDDIMDLLLTCDALKHKYPDTPISLLIPYFPYARQDRVCAPGDPCSANVFLSIINKRGFQLITFDPHTYNIGNTRIIDNSYFIDKVKEDIKFDFVICPDKGALDRYKKVFDKYPTICCKKERDPETGKLSNFFIDLYHTKKEDLDFLYKSGAKGLIIDDICDGGRTFLGIADLFPEHKLSLAVSHGIFSNGLDQLFDKFEYIATTNSWCDLQSSGRLKIYDWNIYNE